MVRVQSANLNDLPEIVHRSHTSSTATVLEGTGQFVAPIGIITEMARVPGASAEIIDFAERLLEQEFAYAMAILDPEDTGIDNTLWFQPVPEGQHGPRIKVAIDPAHTVRQTGTMATVPFDPGKKAEGDISPPLERQVRAFIALNHDLLMRYWRLEMGTKKFLADLKPLSGKR